MSQKIKILVVEDDLPLREVLAHMLRNLAPKAGGIEVLEAGTLDEARELLPQTDAVLCDGSFPTHRGGRPEIMTVVESNWAPMRLDCERLRIPFVMLSGNYSLVQTLNEAGTLAFRKPGQAVDAVRLVVTLGLSTVAARRQKFEDPRVAEADRLNSLPEPDQREESKPRAWWKKFGE